MKKILSLLLVLLIAIFVTISMTACDDDDDDRFDVGRRELDEGRVDLDDFDDD